MATLLVVGLLIWIMLSPNKQKGKPIPKKRLHEERIRTAHQIINSMKEKNNG